VRAASERSSDGAIGPSTSDHRSWASDAGEGAGDTRHSREEKPMTEAAPATSRDAAGGPGHRFTFGLWTVGNPGRDPFGGPTREPIDPVDSVRELAKLGAWGVSLHDEDLVPWGVSASERDRIVARFKGALEETGMGVGMATTNLFGHPAFKDGAFTSNDRRVRRAAIGKAMRSMDLGAELGAEVYVFWGGREGTESGVAKDPRDALERYREAIDVLADYAVGQRYDMRFAIEPKPNEPRGDIFLPTVGHALHFLTTLARSEMVGVNPEVAHDTMAGLSFHHAIGQALWAGKLFHIDLNSQRIGRYDQDFRFGAEDLKECFLLVRLLERGGYTGPLAFDAHAYRNENADGVWDFARGCMSTYATLAERARYFDELPEVQEALAAASTGELAATSVDDDDPETLKAEAEQLDALAERGYFNERLDQLLVEVLMGVR
jgi:xylose isomerase